MFIGAAVGLLLLGSVMATALKAGDLGTTSYSQSKKTAQGLSWKYKAEKNDVENAKDSAEEKKNSELTQYAGESVHFGYKEKSREQNRNQIRRLCGNCSGRGNLTNVSGVLEKNDTIYLINNITLKFGPYRYVYETIATYDYDADGFVETLAEELDGLVGTNVTISGHLNENNELIVFSINELMYRDAGKPEWTGPH